MREYDQAISNHLQEFLTLQRRAKFAQVLSNRTRKITVVLIDLFQEHNNSAVLRTCEAFGIQDVHVVEMDYRFSTKRDIAMGTDRWLTIHRYRGETALDDCFTSLKESGYRTAATVLRDESHPIEDVQVTSDDPIALFLGTEKSGLPQHVIDRTDLKIFVPMYGFVESFNVSVAAALMLNELCRRLRSADDQWHLSEEEHAALLLAWTRKTVPNCQAIERRFLEEWKPE